MNFSDYEEALDSTAVYPEVGTGSLVAITYCALGLGEAGEVQGKVKKIWRDDDGVVTDEKRQAILDEAGDTLWYLARIVKELGSDLETVAAANVAKLHDRRDRGVLGGSGDYR